MDRRIEGESIVIGGNEQRGYAKVGTPVSTLVMAFRDAGCWGWHEGQHAISETPVSGSGERRGLAGERTGL